MKAAVWCRVMLAGTVCTSVVIMSRARESGEWIDTILARQMVAAPRDFLGQDRATHQQDGQQVRGACMR